jgi:hypothetical protein
MVRRFQFHLSTGVAMMAAAGILLGANVYAIRSRTIWDAGLPLLDYPHGRLYSTSLALHADGILPVNIVLNLAGVVIVGILWERIVVRKD